ncbi:hypothetical protein [Paenibacillus xylanexedens]|uniref:hypothetical protein n=1 Tax=Paenibacillus sp. FSL R7-0272 TaxID=2921679 RepID=UPI0012B6C92B|nr:hypothetical protein [Paenibacillus xylanexedens]
MDNLFTEKLLNHISNTLPTISDSVNEISSYIQNNKKVDVELITSLYNLSAGLKVEDLRDSNIAITRDKNTILLYEDYLSGVEIILRGVSKLVSILRYQNGLEAPEGVESFTGDEEKLRIQTESAVDDLYNGSKKVVSVIDRAVE